jgi:hypothetical protein
MGKGKRLSFALLFAIPFYCACGIDYKDWCDTNFGADFFCVENGKNQVFLVESEEISITMVPKLELGIKIFKDVFSMEWKQEDVERVVDDGYINLLAFIPFEKLEGYPIPCNIHTLAGCYSVLESTAWASSTKEKEVDGVITYVERELAYSSVTHEILHAVEYALEGRIDYEHDDFVYRWKDLLLTAKELWSREMESLGY